MEEASSVSVIKDDIALIHAAIQDVYKFRHYCQFSLNYQKMDIRCPLLGITQ